METIITILIIGLIINAVIKSMRKFFSNLLEGIEQTGLQAGASNLPGQSLQQGGSVESTARGLGEIMRKRLSAGRKGKAGPASWWETRHDGDLARQAKGDSDNAMALVISEGFDGITRALQWLKTNYPGNSSCQEERQFIDSLAMKLADLATKTRKVSEAAEAEKGRLADSKARSGKAGPLAAFLRDKNSIRNSIIISEILKRKN